MNHERSCDLYDRALSVSPGGGNSSVRAIQQRAAEGPVDGVPTEVKVEIRERSTARNDVGWGRNVRAIVSPTGAV